MLYLQGPPDIRSTAMDTTTQAVIAKVPTAHVRAKNNSPGYRLVGGALTSSSASATSERVTMLLKPWYLLRTRVANPPTKALSFVLRPSPPTSSP
eukprot:CAMPEP_0115327384 /NCGR_PEP_ID=MMETSP0270-20121206/84102_1 /TAXON_ID=71861 /ORGANISM="Scrippsiella trochoidea, Strain CCMP3099" /LENGTH=94 /DNA_ID=CAMNT_0002747803 /DNA_START=609 /DNA_END=889 /DNA_ORIENTATION=+